MLWLLLLINLVALIMELPSLINKRMYPELATFSVFLAIALYFSLAFYYNWPLKEPFTALLAYMQP